MMRLLAADPARRLSVLVVGVPAQAALSGTSIAYVERTDEGLQILVSVPADATVDTESVAVTIDGTAAPATAVPADDTTSVRRTAVLVIDTSNSMRGAADRRRPERGRRPSSTPSRTTSTSAW